MWYLVPVAAFVAGLGTIASCFAMNMHFRRPNGGLAYPYISQMSEYQPEWFVFVGGIGLTVCCILLAMCYNCVVVVRRETIQALNKSNLHSARDVPGHNVVESLNVLKNMQSWLIRWTLVLY